MNNFGAECSGAVLVRFTETTGGLASCISGPELVGLGSTLCSFRVVLSSFFSSGSATFPAVSFFFSKSVFSGRSSFHILGRGCLVLPRTIRFINPREMSSLSSVLMTSCLKEKPDIDLDTEAGASIALTASAAGVATCGALCDGCDGRVVSSSSGRTFLTTRRTTFTTFFLVRPLSSVVSIGLVQVPLAVVLTTPLLIMPFCSRSLFIIGSGLRGA